MHSGLPAMGSPYSAAAPAAARGDGARRGGRWRPPWHVCAAPAAARGASAAARCGHVQHPPGLRGGAAPAARARAGAPAAGRSAGVSTWYRGSSTISLRLSPSSPRPSSSSRTYSRRWRRTLTRCPSSTPCPQRQPHRCPPAAAGRGPPPLPVHPQPNGMHAGTTPPAPANGAAAPSPRPRTLGAPPGFAAPAAAAGPAGSPELAPAGSGSLTHISRVCATCSAAAGGRAAGGAAAAAGSGHSHNCGSAPHPGQGCPASAGLRAAGLRGDGAARAGGAAAGQGAGCGELTAAHSMLSTNRQHTCRQSPGCSCCCP